MNKIWFASVGTYTKFNPKENQEYEVVKYVPFKCLDYSFKIGIIVMVIKSTIDVMHNKHWMTFSCEYLSMKIKSWNILITLRQMTKILTYKAIPHNETTNNSTWQAKPFDFEKPISTNDDHVFRNTQYFASKHRNILASNHKTT